MGSSVVQYDASVRCPDCESALVVRSGRPIILCAKCGNQFGRFGPWPVERTSTKAIVSLILGLISFGGLFLTGIPALVLGIWALGDLRRQERYGLLRGRGLAIAGAVLGGGLSLATLLAPIGLMQFAIGAGLPKDVEIAESFVAPENVVTIIPRGAQWKWLHPIDDSDPAEREPNFHQAFFQPDYDDSAWKTGRETDRAVGFGYGDPVAVDIGTPPVGQRRTAYFRHRFTTTKLYERLILACTHDDGMIVYLDGEEVGRLNMPEAPESFVLTARQPIGRSAETALVGMDIRRSIEPGEHLLAISLHNSSTTSSDLRLGEMRLYGIRPQSEVSEQP